MQKQTWPVVMCPGCKTQMKVRHVEPVKPGDRMDEITYKCPKCGTETKRQVKRPAP